MTKDQLIAVLSEFQEIYGKLSDSYRERAMRTAISTIKDIPATTASDVLTTMMEHKYPGIGKGILAKVKEIIEAKGPTTELISLRDSPKVQAHKVFEGIIGAGPVTIKRWISAGIFTLPALRRAISRGDITVTNMQRWGLHYYTDLNTRIPRDEVKALGDMIRDVVIQVSSPETMFEITGSYRRGLKDSGDIDILLTTRANYSLLHSLVTLLQSTQGYIDTLSIGDERLTFLYRSHISQRVRQFDILHVKYSSYYASLLYFTGSYAFNTMMRAIAKSKGYRLNQHGLFNIQTGKLAIVDVSSENEIFEAIGMTYIAPHLRN